jgi:hypothetical protein
MQAMDFVRKEDLRRWCLIPAEKLAHHPALRVKFRLVQDSRRARVAIATPEGLKGPRGKPGSSVAEPEERHGLQARDPGRAHADPLVASRRIRGS